MEELLLARGQLVREPLGQVVDLEQLEDLLGAPVGSSSSVASPSDGGMVPASIRSKVVLPLPFGPRRTTQSPMPSSTLTGSSNTASSIFFPTPALA